MMQWARQVFENDLGLANWTQVIEKFGPAIDQQLRGYATVLDNVKMKDLRNRKARPAAYLDFISKLKTKVLHIST